MKKIVFASLLSILGLLGQNLTINCENGLSRRVIYIRLSPDLAENPKLINGGRVRCGTTLRVSKVLARNGEELLLIVTALHKLGFGVTPKEALAVADQNPEICRDSLILAFPFDRKLLSCRYIDSVLHLGSIDMDTYPKTEKSITYHLLVRVQNEKVYANLLPPLYPPPN